MEELSFGKMSYFCGCSYNTSPEMEAQHSGKQNDHVILAHGQLLQGRVLQQP